MRNEDPKTDERVRATRTLTGASAAAGGAPGGRDALAGTRVGNYVIVNMLGQGAMGAVYQGVHATLERPVAIKILHSDLAKHQELIDRFVDEARSVARIRHPGLVEVFDFGVTPTGQLYSVMELIEGCDLEQALLTKGGTLPGLVVAEIGAQVADALAAVHEQGIVHRDLKPGNIMVAAGGRSGLQAKVLDFGIAKLVGATTTRTRAGVVMGTPVYLSPEQAAGSADVGAASDVYALGVVLYEALAGRPPFQYQTPLELLRAHAQESPPPLASFATDAYGPLVSLIDQCLAKNAADRPASIAILAARLRDIVGELGGAERIPSSWARELCTPGATAAAGAAVNPSGTPSARPSGLSSSPSPRLTPDAIAGTRLSLGGAAADPVHPSQGVPEKTESTRRVPVRWLSVAGVAAAALGALAFWAASAGSGPTDRVQPTPQATAVAAGTEPAAPAPANEQPAAAQEDPGDDLATGAAIWRTRCAGCHGTDGNGDGAETPAGLHPKSFKYMAVQAGTLAAYRFEIVERGILENDEYTMPAFADELSEREIRAVVGYIETLAPADPKATEQPESWRPTEPQPAQSDALVARGRAVYRAQCASCHGRQGRGRGRAGRYLARKPADLRSGVFKLRSTRRGELPTDLDLFRTITVGMGVAGMPGFRRLDERDRWAIVAYLKQLAPRFRRKRTAPPLDVPARPPNPDPARGAALFRAAGCDRCHGASGRGDGEKVRDLVDRRGDAIAPPDFRTPEAFIGGSSAVDVYRTMMTGIDGIPMPAGDDIFEPDEAWDVVAFILSRT